MLALVAAATVIVAPAPEQDAAHPRIAVSPSPLAATRACGLWDAHPVRRDAPTAGPQTLAEMPPANLELTVLRLDKDGCSVPVIVRRNISGDGRFAAPGR